MTDWSYWATYYRDTFGWPCIPIGSNKRPAVKWKELQERTPTDEEIERWSGVASGIAIVTGPVSGVVVIDCESERDAMWFWYNQGTTCQSTKTRRGYHLWFRHPGGTIQNAIKVRNRYDIRGNGGYVLVPPSSHSDGVYEWRSGPWQAEFLPLFNKLWLPAKDAAEREVDSGSIGDPRAYIARIVAVKDAGADLQTFKAVLALHRAGLSENEATAMMFDWNETNVQDAAGNSVPWPGSIIRYKIRRVFR